MGLGRRSMIIAHDGSDYTPIRCPITARVQSVSEFFADCLRGSDVVGCTGSPERSAAGTASSEDDMNKSRLLLRGIRLQQEVMLLLPIDSRDLDLPKKMGSRFMESWR